MLKNFKKLIIKSGKNGTCLNCESEIIVPSDSTGFNLKCPKCKKLCFVITKNKKLKKTFLYKKYNTVYKVFVTYDNGFDVKKIPVIKKVKNDYFYKNLYFNGFGWTFESGCMDWADGNKYSGIVGRFESIKWYHEAYQVGDNLPSFLTEYNYVDYVVNDYLKPKEMKQLGLTRVNYKIRDVDLLTLEHHTKRLNRHYTRLYSDDGYNCLEFNKNEIRFMLQHKLSITQLDALKEIKKLSVKKLDNHIRKKREHLIDKKLDALFLKLKHLNKMLDNYYFIVPKTNQELKHEGNVLQHCVGGYGDNLSVGRNIIFMRTNKDEPLYTIEIKDNKVVQFKSKNNNKPPKKAIEVLKKYAEINAIFYDVEVY